jgi:hypothetical protein
MSNTQHSTAVSICRRGPETDRIPERLIARFAFSSVPDLVLHHDAWCLMHNNFAEKIP